MPLDGTELEVFGNGPLAKLGAVERLLITEQHGARAGCETKMVGFVWLGRCKRSKREGCSTQSFCERSGRWAASVIGGSNPSMTIPVRRTLMFCEYYGAHGKTSLPV